MTQKVDNGILREMTTAEQLEYDNRIAEENAKLPQYKLEKIREIRNQKLKETDWLVISEQITDAEKTWRENLRKIPQDYSEADYDDLLARDEQGNLTHTVWSKP
jgi:hypothetical protein